MKGVVKMERVSDEWLNHTIKNGVDRTIGDYYKVLYALEELQASRKVEKPVLPIPCTKGFEDWTVKDYFQKINEELDELKEAVGSPLIATPRELYSVTWSDFPDRAIEERCKKIAEEAADTITAITSMLEAMGIDERQRQAAQMRVNNNNRQRGRC